MLLTPENYHSPEANQEYFSVSQYKNFSGTYGIPGCEAAALAQLRGEWKPELSCALLVGSYVDSHFEGTLDVFKAQHPEIFTKVGDLKAEYKSANEIIARLESDPYFMKFMDGEKQVIMTAEIFGVKWKIKIDALLRKFCITDLKVMKAIRDSFWVKDLGHISFVEYWGYNIQAAIYQKVVELNINTKLPFFIAAASKEKYPDHEIVGFTQQDLDDTLSMVVKNVNRINDLKLGRVEPDRCGVCDYCKATKVLTAPVHFSLLTSRV